MSETPTDRPTTGMAPIRDAAWAAFEVNLAGYLALMDDFGEDDHLLLELPHNGKGAGPYAQFAGADSGRGLLAEVSGNHYLAPEFQLNPVQERRLRRVGWEGNTPDEPNWAVMSPITDAVRLASMTVRALRDVFAIAHPELLTFGAWGPARAFVGMLGLQASDQVPGDIVDAHRDASAASVAFVPADRRELVGFVRDVLRTRLHAEPQQDDDEDFVLQHMGQPVWVRVRKDQPAVEIFARVAHDVYSRRATAVEISLLNRDRAWVKWVLTGRTVFQQILIPGKPFAPAVLDSMISVFSTTMTQTRDDLALRTGAKAA